MTVIISVFGSGTVRPGSALYEEARTLGKLLAEAGFTVATGGYGGVMEGVSRGAREAGGHVIGVTCGRIADLRGVSANAWVAEEVHHATLRARMDYLITRAHGLVTMTGGIGTLGEIAIAWNGMQTREIQPVPCVVMGARWRRVVETFLAEMHDYVRADDVSLVSFAEDPPATIAALRLQLAY